MSRVWENPTQLSERNCRFYQRMELAKVSENATATTGRTATTDTVRKKKGITSSKWGGTKKGVSTGSSVEDIQKGTTARDGEVEARTEDNLSSVYGSVT